MTHASATVETRIPAPIGKPFTEDEAMAYLGQFFHVLINGQSYLAQVYSAKRYDEGTSLYLTGELQAPPPEPDATPLEVDHDGEAYPEVEAA